MQKMMKSATTTMPTMTPMASFFAVLRVVLSVSTSSMFAAAVGRLMLVVAPKASVAWSKMVDSTLSSYAAQP